MATIPRPYTRQVSVFNPQRSAATGQKQALLEELAPALRYYKPQAPVSEMLYSAPPAEVPMVDYLEGGPGVGAFGGEGGRTGIEGTVDEGQGAINAGILGVDNPLGFVLGKGNPLGTIVGMAGRGINAALGDPLGQLGGWLGDQVGNISPAIANALGVGHSMPSGMQGGVPAAQGFTGGDTHGGWGKGQSSEAVAPPPSSLADIGMGGGFDGAPVGAPSGANPGDAAGLGIW